MWSGRMLSVDVICGLQGHLRFRSDNLIVIVTAGTEFWHHGCAAARMWWPGIV